MPGYSPDASVNRHAETEIEETRLLGLSASNYPQRCQQFPFQYLAIGHSWEEWRTALPTIQWEETFPLIGTSSTEAQHGSRHVISKCEMSHNSMSVALLTIIMCPSIAQASSHRSQRYIRVRLPELDILRAVGTSAGFRR